MYSSVKFAKSIQQMFMCNGEMCVCQGEIETHRKKEFVWMLSFL